MCAFILNLSFEYAEQEFLGVTLFFQYRGHRILNLATAFCFYGTDRPIRDGTTFADRVGRFHLAFNLLAQEKQRTPAEQLILEVDAINEAIEEQGILGTSILPCPT